MARSARLGRGVVYTGEHLEQEELQSGDAFRYRSRWGPSVPVSTPGFLLNRVTMAAFNGFYYFLKRKGAQLASVDYDSYFFPLDNINHWNRLYGRRGFLQYQFVLPAETGAEGLKEVLEKVSAAGQGSFLAVLKRFGAANSNLLSFPRGGYTLALDFKWQRRLFPLLDELDRLVIDRGGRHYLAKDARLSEAVFKAGYPNWEKFAAIKEQVDPTGLFASLQSSRIGLTPGASP